jgi:hypothetical protein
MTLSDGLQTQKHTGKTHIPPLWAFHGLGRSRKLIRPQLDSHGHASAVYLTLLEELAVHAKRHVVRSPFPF